MSLELAVRPTADVDLSRLRAFLDETYSDYDDDAFGHAQGGLHVLVTDDDTLVAHGAVIQRQLFHDGRPLRTGYVESVGVHPERRRQGLAGVVMTEVERLIRGGFEVGALASSKQGVDLYAGRDWVRWPGPLSALTGDGVVPTPADRVFVLPVAATLDLTGELTCDRRTGKAW